MLIVAFGMLLFLLLPVLWLRGGLFQEPAGTALSALSVELSGGWRSVGDEGEVVLKQSELNRYLRSQEGNGWELFDQMGSGYVYLRDDETRVLVCRLYSTRFRICPTFDRS